MVCEPDKGNGWSWNSGLVVCVSKVRLRGSCMLYDLANPGRDNLSKVKGPNARVSKIQKIRKYTQHKYSTNHTMSFYFNTNTVFLVQIIIFRTENLNFMAFVFPLLFTTASHCYPCLWPDSPPPAHGGSDFLVPDSLWLRQPSRQLGWIFGNESPRLSEPDDF